MPAISSEQQPLHGTDEGSQGGSEEEESRHFNVLLTGFGPFSNHTVNPSWLAVKALHNVTITSDQWEEVFGGIVLATAPSNNTNNKGASTVSPSTVNGKGVLGNGEASTSSAQSGSSTGVAATSSSKDASPAPALASTSTATSIPIATTAPPPSPPLPDPGPYTVHLTSLEIPVLYQAVLDIVPGLHLKPPKLPAGLPADFPPAPENGYDFIFHVGVAGRGSLRMEIIGHRFGYNMKDASGAYCAVVPPPAKTNPNLGPAVQGVPPGGAGGTGAVVPAGQYVPYRGAYGLQHALAHGGRFGGMGMGYNNERLGYNPAVHDPIPGSETSVRPVRGFGTPYETFPDEMMTDIDVTRLVQDLKSTGIKQIYTSMDAGHYLCDFIYYCSLAEGKRSSKALFPFMPNSPYFNVSPHYGPAYGPMGSNSYHQSGYQPPFPGAPPAPSANSPPPPPPAAAALRPAAGGAAHHHHPHGTHPHGTHLHGHALGNGFGMRTRPAQVLFMHCPPVKEPLSSEEVTEAIRRIVLWVCREIEIADIRERAEAPEEGVAGY